MCTRSRNSDAPGFTLLELILVMVIIAVALGIAAPSLRSFNEGQQTTNTARKMLALMQQARSRAVNEGRVYRFNYDRNEGIYWLTVQNAAEFVELHDDFGDPYYLPDGMVAEWLDSADDEDPRDFVAFYPSGRCEPGTLQLTDENGQVAQLHCDAPTRTYRILTRAEREKYRLD
jgi:type II secretion system protein H